MQTARTSMYLLLSVVVIAGAAIIGFDTYVGSDSSTKLFIQEAAADHKPDPTGQVGILPLSENLPVWTPGDRAFNPPHNHVTMDNANVVFNVVIPYLGGWIHEDVTPYFADPSVAFRYVTLILNAGYDASAPYHATAVGVYSNIENRPASEWQSTDKYINTATMHAIYQLAMEFDPAKKDHWDSMMDGIDLNPDDKRGLDLDCSVQGHDLSDPVVIGNLAGKCVIEGRMNSGFGSYEPSGTYPIIADSTNYTPVNTVNTLNDPSRWQPLMRGDGMVQQFVTPQWANTEPYTYGLDPRSIRTAPPTSSNYAENYNAYKVQADEVRNAVAELTDRQKIIAEYFDNKAREVIFFPGVEVNNITFRTADFYRLDFMLHIAQFDAGIVTWQEKARHDAVRPITAIQYLYAGQDIPTFNGETVDGSAWTPYVDTGDHPEYPSATACFCAAQAEAWKSFYGDSDDIPTNLMRGNMSYPAFTETIYNGTSIYEPGVTPSTNVTVSYDKWSDYVAECGESRIWSGLHFRAAVEESIEVCTDIGTKAFNYFDTLLEGTANSPRAYAMPLSPDTSLPFATTELVWLANNPTISVGYVPSWPPYEYVDSNGNLVGVSGDIAKRFSQLSGVNFVQATSIESWTDTLDGLRDGSVDVALMITDTGDANRAGIDFTEPWFNAPTHIIVKDAYKDTININNLTSQRVVSVAGYAINSWLTANNISYDTVPTTDDALRGVADGTYDAYVENWDVANYLITQNRISGLSNAGESGYTYDLAIGYPEGEITLGSIMQKLITEIEGEQESIIREAVERSNRDLGTVNYCR